MKAGVQAGLLSAWCQAPRCELGTGGRTPGDPLVFPTRVSRLSPEVSMTVPSAAPSAELRILLSNYS